MRPTVWDTIHDDESLVDYYDRMGLHGNEYYTDYGDEYLRWGYGGFALPKGYNFDNNKLLHTKGFTKPKTGFVETTIYMKRLHWSTQAVSGFDVSKSFLPSNIYDLKNDKASQISILYDTYSEKGSNIYVITDRGAGILLTKKNILSDIGGNSLGYVVAESTLVAGELWLSHGINCPREFWRGKSEGIIRLPNNIKVSALVFPSDNDIIILSNDSFMGIASNNRKNILSAIESIDTDHNFDTALFSVIDESENNILVGIGGTIFTFLNDVNNWGGHVTGSKLIKVLNVPHLYGSTNRNMLANIIQDFTGDLKITTLSHKLPARASNTTSLPYVFFSVNPSQGHSCEFTDMFISATYKPSSVTVSVNKDLSDPFTILSTNIIQYAPGLFHIKNLGRTGANKVLIGKVLYVKIQFSDHTYFYDVKQVKTGYNNVVGG